MPSISGAKTIRIKGDTVQWEEGPLATAPALPGMNLVLAANAQALGRDSYAPGLTLVGGAGAGGASPIKLVIEQALYGKSVNDAYAVGDNVRFIVPKKGDVVQVLVVAGQTITKGLGGGAAASGKWQVAATNAVGEFLEASGGALAADTLMRLRVY
jgi:hypothetical protein